MGHVTPFQGWFVISKLGFDIGSVYATLYPVGTEPLCIQSVHNHSVPSWYRAALYQVGTEPLTFLPTKRLYPSYLTLPQNKPFSLL